MSWWVKEISTITEDQSERLCTIETDTPNDLPNPVRTKPDPDNPGQTITDYTIVRGSEAYCLSNSKFYKLNSQGQWVEQKSGQEIEISADDIVYDNTDSGLTATNVQDAIEELHDTDETQDNALVELYEENANQQLEINYAINTGAKNRCPYDGFTASEAGTVINDQPISLSAGNYIISYDTTATTGSSAVLFLYNGNSIANKTIYNDNTGKCSETITLDSDANQIRFYTGVACTVSNLMIRYAEITNATFQPYALPNPTLTPAVIKAVDEGAKNLVNAPSDTGVRIINIPVVLQPGDYYVLFQNITTTDTDASTCQFGAFADDASQASNYPQLKRENNTGAMFTVTKQTSYVRLYASSSFAGGAGDTVTFTGCMICTAADWAVSQEYVPYAPTNRELYEMILALQSGRSVQSVNSLSTLNLGRNDLNESLDTNFDLIDSIPEEEEGELE